MTRTRIPGPHVKAETAVFFRALAEDEGCKPGALLARIIERLRRYPELHGYIMGYPHSREPERIGAEASERNGAEPREPERIGARRTARTSAEAREPARTSANQRQNVRIPRASSSSSSSSSSLKFQGEEERRRKADALELLSSASDPAKEERFRMLGGFASQLRRGVALSELQCGTAADMARQVGDYHRPRAIPNVGRTWTDRDREVEAAAVLIALLDQEEDAVDVLSHFPDCGSPTRGR